MSQFSEMTANPLCLPQSIFGFISSLVSIGLGKVSVPVQLKYGLVVSCLFWLHAAYRPFKDDLSYWLSPW